MSKHNIDKEKEREKMGKKQTFAEKHPKLNFLLGLILLIGIVIVAFLVAKWILEIMGNGVTHVVNYVENFVSTSDQVIVVAMITGAVSITGVVISSIVAKVVDYRYNVKKYLYDKREEPYKQFVEMIYKIMEDTKRKDGNKMTEEEITQIVSEFSKGLTLWGSNRVVKKWLKYRKSSIKGDKNMLWEMEDIIYEIRKDVGLGRRLKKGDMLSFFVNDIENLK